MFINTSKSKILQDGKQEEDIHVYCNGKELAMVVDFTYLRAVLDRSEKIDSEI